MKCEEVRDEMIAYLKNELDEELRREVDEHLARCQGCQRELQVSGRVLHQTEIAGEQSVVTLANTIIKDAVDMAASDIHIDPGDEGAEIKFRIDGVLHRYPVKKPLENGRSEEKDMLSREERDAVTARIKFMADISLAEAHLPQDGSIPARLDDRDYDLRVSTIPALYGDKIVVRILSQTGMMLGLDRMDFSPEQLDMVRSLLHQPNGLVICTGPVGSGRTTLMYSMLLDIMNPAISIVTVEHPVECQIRGAQQVAVSAKTGLTFAEGIRSLMRQDPDVIMVGEIPDLETATLTVSAAITGHLVLSGLHTWDAASAITRLANCGVETWLIGNCLRGVIAQRLARKVCNECREEYTPSDEALDFLGLRDQVGKTKFYQGAGCEKCKGTGFCGRTAVHEVLIVDPDMSKMIGRGEVDPDELRSHAYSRGFVGMVEDGRRQVLEGITTAEEVYRLLSVR